MAEHFDNGEPDVVPYHFKVLFDEGRAVTNIKLGGTWRNEIDVEYPPLEKGDFFM